MGLTQIRVALHFGKHGILLQHLENSRHKKSCNAFCRILKEQATTQKIQITIYYSDQYQFYTRFNEHLLPFQHTYNNPIFAIHVLHNGHAISQQTALCKSYTYRIKKSREYTLHLPHIYMYIGNQDRKTDY